MIKNHLIYKRIYHLKVSQYGDKLKLAPFKDLSYTEESLVKAIKYSEDAQKFVREKNNKFGTSKDDFTGEIYSILQTSDIKLVLDENKNYKAIVTKHFIT